MGGCIGTVFMLLLGAGVVGGGYFFWEHEVMKAILSLIAGGVLAGIWVWIIGHSIRM